MDAHPKICFSFDVEYDCPPFLSTWRGVEDGMPLILKLLSDEKVRATFFCIGEVARRFPKIIERIVIEGHELGCHGDTHIRLSKIKNEDVIYEITNSSIILRSFTKVTSFRAPNLDLPEKYLSLLVSHGYLVDSSQARYKIDSLFARPSKIDGLVRLPTALPPSVLRLSKKIQQILLTRLPNFSILFFHPWEFIDLTKAKIPFDCRFRTGDKAINSLKNCIQFFKNRGFYFYTISELGACFQ